MAARPKAVVIIGAVAVAIAAVAALSLYKYLKDQEARVRAAVATAKVVAASQEIAAGDSIRPDQVKLTDWPKANVPFGSFSSIDQVAGRVTRDTVTPDEAVVESRLVPAGGQAGVLIHKIPQGHRAITVAVDQVAGVAGFVTPGSKVDVVLTINPGTGPSISKIVLQNIPALAVGQIVEQREGKPVLVPTVTMDVTPAEAETLALAGSQGKLQMVLRRTGDTEVAKTSGATITKVMTAAGTAVSAESGASARVKVSKKPVKKEAEELKVETVEKPQVVNVDVWRGAARSVETFTKDGR